MKESADSAIDQSVYDYEKLIAETRRIAYEYRKTTGQSLPLTAEIARYDAKKLLNLSSPGPEQVGVDAVRLNEADPTEVVCCYLIKGRAFFNYDKSGQRVGQINFDGQWDKVLLVMLDERYMPESIYEASRAAIESNAKAAKPNKRGIFTVAKFKAIADCVWQRPEAKVPE